MNTFLLRGVCALTFTLGIALAFTLGSGNITSAQAQSNSSTQFRNFNPSAKCAQILLTQDSDELRMASFWAFGYISRANDTALTVNPKRVKTVIGILTRACSKDSNQRFDSLVEVLSLALKKKNAKKTSQNTNTQKAYPGISNLDNSMTSADREKLTDSIRNLLEKFYAPGADYVALTASLKPTAKDIRTIYGEPFASALVARNNRLFKLGISFRPKREHETYLILLTTTRKLQNGHVDLGNFPGGYKKINKFFIKNVPIARFKFVKRGEKLGLSFDGLIFVNGRWVLIPKPWRALEK